MVAGFSLVNNCCLRRSLTISDRSSCNSGHALFFSRSLGGVVSLILACWIRTNSASFCFAAAAKISDIAPPPAPPTPSGMEATPPPPELRSIGPGMMESSLCPPSELEVSPGLSERFSVEVALELAPSLPNLTVDGVVLTGSVPVENWCCACDCDSEVAAAIFIYIKGLRCKRWMSARQPVWDPIANLRPLRWFVAYAPPSIFRHLSYLVFWRKKDCFITLQNVWPQGHKHY